MHHAGRRENPGDFGPPILLCGAVWGNTRYMTWNGYTSFVRDVERSTLAYDVFCTKCMNHPEIQLRLLARVDT